MKKFIKLLFFVCLFNFRNAQLYYSYYLDATSEWKVISKQESVDIQTFYFKTIYFDGFEDIDGYTYYKMYVSQYQMTLGGSYFEIEVEPANNFLTYQMGYLREDPNGKYYFKNNLPGNIETVYFDNQSLINAQIGDNLSSIYTGNTLYSPPFLDCPIYTINYMNIAGINSKYVNFSQSSLIEIENMGKIMEGVGVLMGSCAASYLVDATLSVGFDKIYCYTKQGQTYQFYDNIYIYRPIDCITSFLVANRVNLSTNPVNSVKVAVYPNPSTGVFYIDNQSTNFKSVTIYNILGQEMKQQQLQNSNEEVIDISTFSKGIYFLKFDGINSTSEIKIVKE